MSAQDLMLIRLNLGEDPDNQKTHVLSNEALEAWLDRFDGNTDRVTHRALITIASSEVLTSKKITSQDLSSDGPAVSAELRALAETYKQAADTSDDTQYFAGYIAPPVSQRREAEEYRWPS